MQACYIVLSTTVLWLSFSQIQFVIEHFVIRVESFGHMPNIKNDHKSLQGTPAHDAFISLIHQISIYMIVDTAHVQILAKFVLDLLI